MKQYLIEETDIENVVYFLGSGFSAQFELPTIAGFMKAAKRLRKAKKLEEPRSSEVFAEFKRLDSVMRHFHNVDMENIEEVLSILQINSLISDTKFDMMSDFVCEVINKLTRKISPSTKPLDESRWRGEVFGTDRNFYRLGLFVAGLLDCNLALAASRVASERQTTTPRKYDIVTTNYDMLLEDSAEFISKRLANGGVFAFRKGMAQASDRPVLAKLHGCVSTGHIVPPISIKAPEAHNLEAWKLGLDVISKAQHLRFIGFSLQEVDAPVRYLLKAARQGDDPFERIDVLCEDQNQEVEKRFKSFFPPSKVRFRNVNFGVFLSQLESHFIGQSDEPSPADCLEQAWENVMITRNLLPSQVPAG
jgi:hypothetical protein